MTGSPSLVQLASANAPTSALIDHDPWWLTAIKVLIVFLFLMLTTLLMIWAERRVIGRMQQRSGPNRAGKFGLLQSLMDGIKLPLKEDIVPRGVDKILFWLAPAIATIPAFISIAIIPFGPVVSIFGHQTPLQLANLPVAVLLVLAMSSMGVYGIVLAGWSSSSPYSLLGGLRSSAQVISYEIAMGISFVPVFLYAGSLSTSQIVAAQAHGSAFHLFGAVLHYPSWFAILLLPSFVIYVITMVGETNRLPFDLPEGEGELVGGFHTEYSSLKFALFYLAEYVNMITVSALATTLFLGGWHAVWPISVWSGANSGWWPVLWFLAKLVAFLFFFIWLRGSLPQDQVRPADGARLEGPDPGGLGLDAADRDAAGVAAPGRQHRGLPGRRADRRDAADAGCSPGTSPASAPPNGARSPRKRAPSSAAEPFPSRRWTCRTTTASWPRALPALQDQAAGYAAIKEVTGA